MPSAAMQRMLDRVGKSAVDFRSNSAVGQIFRRAGIRRTKEFERIFFLPRRDWPRLSEDGYRERLSEYLRVPGSSATLREAQVAVLTELFDYKGCVGQIGLGLGKTLITALAPTIVNAQRPVLLAPAKLRDKTKRDFERYRLDWLVHPRIEFISYTQLGRDRWVDLLEDLQPDLIMADECHKLKNLDAAVTRRLSRRMKNAPDTMCMFLSGTLTSRSVHDYWHLLMWAIGEKLMPLPTRHDELEEWGYAVDEKVEAYKRIEPGALVDFLPPHLDLPPDTTELTKARIGLHHRLNATPGFVMTRDAGVNASIELELVKPPKSNAVGAALTALRETFTTPNGEELASAMDVWRVARQLSCGFYYQWVPGAPAHWLEARKHWSRYVRQILSTSRKLDSPMAVQNAVTHGKLKEPYRMEHPTKPEVVLNIAPERVLERWLEVRPAFSPSPVAHWIDDSYLRWLLAKHVLPKKLGPSLIWVEHAAVGEKLVELTGFPYCNVKARDAQGRHIEDLGGQSVICSISSCGEGVNLQQWARNIIVSCPPNGPVWEQVLGRTHRSGQEADNIEVVVLNSCEEQEAGFDQAVRDAQYAFETTGQSQRLLLVDRV